MRPQPLARAPLQKVLNKLTPHQRRARAGRILKVLEAKKEILKVAMKEVREAPKQAHKLPRPVRRNIRPTGRRLRMRAPVP